jgi:regulatory protein
VTGPFTSVPHIILCGPRTSDTLLFSVHSLKKPRKLTAEELFEYAVKLLGVRGYSSGDLHAKLRLKAAETADIERALSRLREIGYLDDQRYARSFASARVENQGFGRIRVLNDLRARRIPGNLADQAVAQALEGRTEADLIDSYIERRMASLVGGGPIGDERQLAAAYRRLRRAGFTSGAILTALKRKAARPELVDDTPEEDEEN